MKKIIYSFFLIILFFSYIEAISQNVFLPDSIIRNNEGKPLYMRNQMIVKFNPSIVDTALVNDTNLQTGIISDFINPFALQMIIDSGYFNSSIANLNIKKIHRKMLIFDTLSISRLGESIIIPEFWSTFLIEYNTIAGMSFEDALDTLGTMSPLIEYAHPNYIYELDGTPPNDPRFLTNQKGVHITGFSGQAIAQSIDIDPAWDLTTGSSIIRVGIYDTGIQWSHDDFSEDNSWIKSRIKGGWDWINNQHASATSNFDIVGHGTRVAAIIGAIRNNGKFIAGIAGGNASLALSSSSYSGISLYGLKTGENYMTDNNVLDALMEGSTSFNGTYGYSLNIMNLSWGGASSSISLQNQMRYAFQNKVLIFCSAGNRVYDLGTQSYGPTFEHYPVGYRDEWLMAVGASDETGNYADLSNYGHGISIDFVAPGTSGLNSTLTNTSNTSYSTSVAGTSFSTPIVAGTAALMLSYCEENTNIPNKLAPEDVEILLEKAAINYANLGTYDNKIGFGKIIAGATLESMKWPRFEIRHYKQTFNSSTASLISTTYPNLFTIVKKYKLTKVFNITQPSGRTILDVWKRNSSSTLYGSGSTDEVNCEVISWNQTSATMEGYIYHSITTRTIYVNGHPTPHTIDKWWPITAAGLNSKEEMDLTVYSEDPLATNMNSISIKSELVRLFPNPNNGNFTIAFGLLKNTTVLIELTDACGKIVYKSAVNKEMEGHIEYNIETANLRSGLYFCNIITSEGKICKKITIIK
ncbi:MAG: S8 family serine peptidase [bacterium]|nr:S8 family serine peptidase [bacterium]